MSAPALGDQIRERRRALGMTQAKLADLVGVRPSVLGSWEHGEDLPLTHQMEALAQILLFDPEVVTAWEEAASTPAPPDSPAAAAPPARSPRRPVAARILGALGAADPFRETVVDGSQERPPWWQRLLGPLAPVRPPPAARKGRTEGRRGRRRSSTVTGVAQMETEPDDAGAGSVRPYWEDPEEQRVYLLRWMGTLVLLGVFAVALVWAFIQLWGGLGAFIDLFRSDETTTEVVDAIGTLRVLASG